MHKENINTTKFVFSDENIKKAQEIIKKYPEGKQRSAIMPLLYLAQEQNNNWISIAVMDYIAEMLSIPTMYVYEVANFYTMYNKKPVGKYLIQLCRTTPCWLCGSDKILEKCRAILGIDIGETTDDKMFSLMEVECIGACKAAPAIQINDNYYENMKPEKMLEIIKSLKKS
jgi:NADH-quinone oxidoreductase subunit E